MKWSEAVAVQRLRFFLQPMSAFGPKRTFHYVAFDVAIGRKADMSLCTAHVCF